MSTQAPLKGSLPTEKPARSSRGRPRVGLLGCGCVGSEVARELLGRAASEGGGPVLSHVAVAHPGKRRSVDLTPSVVTSNALTIVKDPTIDVVVELIGGTSSALSLVRQALAEGKSVVTANKELVALHGTELFDLAFERGVGLYCEGSVGGAVPMFRTVAELARGDRIRKLTGVLNGTCNFILTRIADGEAVVEAAAAARAAGYAEADPSDDLSGRDAARKLAILAARAFDARVSPDDVFTSGIEDLTGRDVIVARALGLVVKLVAVAEEHRDFLDLRVEPCALATGTQLSGLDGADNGLVVDAELSGTLTLSGAGAGGRETAGAVLSDLARAVHGQHDHGHSRPERSARVIDGESLPGRFFVRCRPLNRLSLGDVRHALLSHGVQVERSVGIDREIGLVTGFTERACLRRALFESAEARSTILRTC